MWSNHGRIGHLISEQCQLEILQEGTRALKLRHQDNGRFINAKTEMHSEVVNSYCKAELLRKKSLQ